VPRQLEQTSRGVKLVLEDGSKPVDDSPVSLQIDGKDTPLAKQRLGTKLTVDTGVLAGLHLAGEAHTGVLKFQNLLAPQTCAELRDDASTRVVVIRPKS
jgi:hypothetical protein